MVRLPRHARLVLPLLAFASVAANGAAGVLPMATIGVWYVLVFVWIGLWTTPTTAIAFGPVAAASYLLPFAFGAPQSGGVVTAVVLVIPVAVLVGVSIGRKTTADSARRTAEERLATILDSAPIALFACDAEGKITFNQGNPLLVRPSRFLPGDLEEPVGAAPRRPPTMVSAAPLSRSTRMTQPVWSGSVGRWAGRSSRPRWK